MEVLELQSLPGIRYSASLAQAGPTCQRLHTLVACGLSQLTLELLEHLPCLECLALNFCHADSVQGLCKLQKLRCLCLRGLFEYLLACPGLTLNHCHADGVQDLFQFCRRCCMNV